MNMHQAPEEFAARMIEMHGDEGRDWIAQLPGTLAEYAQRWSCTIHSPFGLSYNYVAPVTRQDGTEAVLKMGFPNRELLSEMYALQHYAGQGMIQLLEADFENQVFLLERLRPGVELVTLKGDDAATRVAAEVMQKLWRPVSTDVHPLTVENWTTGIRKIRPYYGGTTGPFPEHLVDAAEQIFADFIPAQGERVLLHGDLHHWNILSATRAPWLALDPKGVIGEREYEVGAWIRNPNLDRFDDAELKAMQLRRLDIFSELLGFDRQRMIGWSLAQAVLSSWWVVEDHGEVGWQAIRCAEALYDFARQ